MKRVKGRFYSTTIFIIIMLLCVSIFFIPTTHAKNKQVIRVGYPIQPGLTMKDEDGRYSGYTYDYLKEIAQYAGLEYEFVEVPGDLNEQLTTLFKMLEKGEIDLMGSMSYSEATSKMYDFPSENYGNAYTVLAVADSDNALDEFTLPDAKEVKVALWKQADTKNKLFYQYAKMSGMSYSIVWCESSEEVLDAIKKGKADAFLSVDIALDEGYRAIAKFSPNQIYFATTKGNSQLIQELNRAMSNINEINPMLMSTLYDKYFNKGYTLNLNQKEKEYIEKKKVLKVLVQDGFAPIQYIKENDEPTGISVSILEHIARDTGFKIEYVHAATYDEYLDILKKGEVDMLLATTYDYDVANKLNVNLSNPFLNTSLVTVVGRGIDVNNLEDKMLAVRGESELTSEQMNNEGNIHHYDTSEEKLIAIENGECDYGYVNSLTLSYLLAKHRFKNIISYPQMNETEVKYSFGITKQSSNLLTAILNKGIRAIKSSELEGYIYQNAQITPSFSFTSYMEENIGLTITVIIIIVSGIFLIIYAYYHKQLKMKKVIELENKRYHSLSDITNEIIFEYDYLKDSLCISDRVIESYTTFALNGECEDLDIHALYEPLMEMKDTDIDVCMKISCDKACWYRVIIKVIYDKQQPILAIGKAQNIHEDKMERERLEKQSEIDGLTNVYNSATCKKKIQELLKTSENNHAFCIIDVDYFKSINDRYGHYVGDQVLIHIAEILQEVFYESSIIGRLGGDEFVVFVNNVKSKEQVEEMCRIFIKHLMLPKHNKDGEIPIATISIGIAMTKGTTDFTAVYKRADEALYHVKKTGKNNYYTYE